MAYSSKEKRNAYMLKYRNKNKARIAARRKVLRDTFPMTKEYEKSYYSKNREKIIERNKSYRERNPQVKKRAQEKFKLLGKAIQKGKRDRKTLSKAYLAALIREEGSDKTIVQKKKEVLKYRLKKIIKKIDNEK